MLVCYDRHMETAMKLTKSQQKVIDTKAAAKRVWILMCEHDGIDPDSKFVVFSNSNPFAKQYSDAQDLYYAAVKAERKNQARRMKHDAFKSCGLNRVVGALL